MGCKSAYFITSNLSKRHEFNDIQESKKAKRKLMWKKKHWLRAVQQTVCDGRQM